MMRKGTGTRSGFSLVELMVAMLILAALLGAMGMTIMQGSGAFQQGVAANVVESQARRGLDRIAAEFLAAETASLTPAPTAPFGASSVDFDKVTGFAGGVATVVPMRMEFQRDPGELDDGIDNDGDGVIDEGRVVLMENFGQANQVNRVLCTNVRELAEGELANVMDDNGNGLEDEGGFSLELQGETLNIRLSLERLDPDQNSLIRTIETSVLLRN
jgi:prepilin-type N-terminal cleavage/methylation domain-containing protein